MKNFLILSVVIIFFNSCNYDQVTLDYSNYGSAQEEDFFTKGWIPYQLIDSSMTNIHLRANLDANTYIFSFSTEKPFTNMPPLGLYQLNEPLTIHGIDIPEWWNNEVQNKPKTTYPISSHGDEYINTVLDEKKGRLYGWNKKSR